MSFSARFSFVAPVFNGIKLPDGSISGYTAIINKLRLKIPYPKQIFLVGKTSKRISHNDYMILPTNYVVLDTNEIGEIEALYNHLVFALKYEGVNLLAFKALVNHYTENELIQLISLEPTGQYSRRIWFLIEWLLGKELKGVPPNQSKKSYIEVIDPKLQYAIQGIKSSRHVIINNLPGTIDFCPLIHKTEKLEKYINENLSDRKSTYLNTIQKSILQRASAFLLLKDSKASFTIEGETPLNNRAVRWGKAIGQAGGEELSKEELNRLQQIVIENSRFVELGFRKKGGFVGEHDRDTATPIPEHISAKWQDVEQLIDGLIATSKLIDTDYDAVLAAAAIAFGFVFIHPFEDGNGRLHRYIIHHVLAKKKFTQQGIIFPISASILDHIDDYRKALESYSHPLLDFIQWEETDDHNVEVINDTIDFYRYFDATKQAEFLYDCVNDTLERVIPEEINYLQCYDEFKKYLDNTFEMPDKMVALLIGFLDQNNGKISKRAQSKELSKLTEAEVNEIEKVYNEIFMDRSTNSFVAIMEDAELAKNQNNYKKALIKLEEAKYLAETNMTLRNNLPLIVCRQALCTYKLKEPSELDAYIKAKQILEELNPMHSQDTEVLGLSGAIDKRLFELTEKSFYLDSAIKYYEKGFQLKQDYYNGINASFMLYKKAAILKHEKNDWEDTKLKADYIRNTVLEIALNIQEGTDFNKREDAIWVLLTIAEAYNYKGNLSKLSEYEEKAKLMAEEKKDGFALSSYHEQKQKIEPLFEALKN